MFVLENFKDGCWASVFLLQRTETPATSINSSFKVTALFCSEMVLFKSICLLTPQGTFLGLISKKKIKKSGFNICYDAVIPYASEVFG